MTIADKIYERLKAAPPEVARQVLEFLERLEAERTEVGSAAKKPASWDDFMGILKDSPTFKGDPVEIQRRMRDEWTR